MSDTFYYLCTHDECKLAYPKYQYLKSHFSAKHPSEEPPSEDDCRVEEVPEGYTLRGTGSQKNQRTASDKPSTEVKPDPPPQETQPPPKPPEAEVYKQADDPSSILRKIMSDYPKMSEAVIKEVMSWVEYKGTLHPSEVRHLLTQMADVPKGAPDVISQKYQLAVMNAAQKGNAEVQMAVTNWQYGPQPNPENPMLVMPGQQFSPVPGQQFPMRNPNQMGVPFNYPASPYMGYPQYPYGPGSAYGYPPQGAPPERETSNPEIDAKFSQVNEAVESIAETVKVLSRQIIETEEEKQRKAMDDRLTRIEESITLIGQRPANEEANNATADAIKEIMNQIASIREEATAARFDGLTKQVADLTEALSKNKEDQITALKAEIAETKKLAENKPTVGRTEMDIIGSVADKALETVKEAGKDVRAIVMRTANREDFDPRRTTAADRSKEGGNIAAMVEGEADLNDKENTFLNL